MFYDRKKLFDGIRSRVPKSKTLSQSQVDGIELLVAEGESRNFNTEWIAYVLATAWHETAATMQPVRETLAKTDEQAISRLNTAYRNGKLKVSKNYWSGGYFGRGYVQLTHEYNYKKMGDWLKIDLVNNPSLALDPKISSKIIYEGMLRGMFTAKKLSDYLDGIDGTDEEDFKQFEAARRIVNGVDKSKVIANLAIKFEAALRESEGAAPVVVAKTPRKKTTAPIAEKPAPTEAVKPKEEEVIPMPVAPQNEPKPAMKSTTIWGALGTLIASMIGILVNLNPFVQVLLIVMVAAFVFWIIRERLNGNKDIEGLF